MPLPRADLESLLRTRRLDRTLTTALPPPAPQDELALAPTALADFDARLDGGFPRGHLSEIVGPRSSGRTSLLLRTLAAATRRGELVALVDALDMFDVASGEAAGIDLSRLLWIRGHVVANPGMCRDMNQRAMDQSVKALTLVLQAGNFGVVAWDVGEAPADAIRRLPFTTWLRLQRMVEGSQTVCVLLGNEPMARSAAGLTLRVGAAAGSEAAPVWPLRRAPVLDRSRPGRFDGEVRTDVPVPSRPAHRFAGPLFHGLDVNVRVVRARHRAHEEAAATLTAVVSPHA